MKKTDSKVVFGDLDDHLANLELEKKILTEMRDKCKKHLSGDALLEAQRQVMKFYALNIAIPIGMIIRKLK